MAASILCLDLGTSTGWALASAAAQVNWPEPMPGAKGPIEGVESGQVKFTGPFACRLLSLSNFLETMFLGHCVTVVVFETPIPFHKSIQAARISWGMSAVVELVGIQHKIKVLEKPNSTIKKHFTGSGRAPKSEIIYACGQRGWHPKSHDEADALALLDLTCSLFKQARDKEVAR